MLLVVPPPPPRQRRRSICAGGLTYFGLDRRRARHRCVLIAARHGVGHRQHVTVGIAVVGGHVYVPDLSIAHAAPAVRISAFHGNVENRLSVAPDCASPTARDVDPLAHCSLDKGCGGGGGQCRNEPTCRQSGDCAAVDVGTSTNGNTIT